MGQRQPWTEARWQTEVEYMKTIDMAHPGSNFNRDRACAARYVTMQLNYLGEDLGVTHQLYTETTDLLWR